jgi:hypothetical protein
MTSTRNGFPHPGDLPGPDGTGATGRWPFGLEADEVERPHVVVTLDTRTGAATFSGPYCTALGALCAADVEYQVDRDQGGKGELTFHVAALEAPIGSDDPDPPCDVVGGVRTGHDGRPLAQALALLTTAAERAIWRRARLTAGTIAVAAAGSLVGAGDGWMRRVRTPRHRHVLGREAR